MAQSKKPMEVWVQIHYRRGNENIKYNLQLPKGEKKLDGLMVEFDRQEISGGQRLLVYMESEEPIEIASFILTGSLDYGSELCGIFGNGYQSWTESFERRPNERISALNFPGKLLSLQQSGDERFYSYPDRRGCFHGYSYAYLRYSDRLFLVCSLDESVGFTIIGTDIRHGLFTLTKDLEGHKLTGQQKILDLALLEGSESDVFGLYADMHPSSLHNAPRALAWMSEPVFPRRLDEVSIRRNLSAFRDSEIPLNYFIIGNGWQSALGEWKLTASGFPSGMASLCAEIRGSGYTPGLWFAPFVVSVDSTIFRTRKDWLAREPGKPLKPAGRISRGHKAVFALNLSRKDVREYITENYIRISKKWRYNLIVLDMLYVAGLYSRDGLSRGGAMNEAIQFLYKLKHNTIWLVNGVPLAPCFGKTDYARVGADSSPCWEHPYYSKIHFNERPSTINALRSVVGRRQLNGRFFGSAAATFYLKNSAKRGSMDAHQIHTQLLLCLLFGTFVSTSDFIGGYNPQEMKMFLSLFPFVQPQIDEVSENRRLVRVCYQLKGRKYISISNLADRSRTYKLPQGNWFSTPVPGHKALHITGGKLQQIKSGESRNYLLLEEGDSFAGSSGHIFPGAEIDAITRRENDWHILPAKECRQSFQIWLRTDANTIQTIDGKKPENIANTLYPCLISAEIAYKS
ncbi:MAG: hypothetical protein B0D92_04845 [Spirochaeta sp. LUC14_002_19_P3]|nr:MAG: hypothetical protein B0D92_04845 [Spirochaeta sp. LUC14_002_19_P3]